MHARRAWKGLFHQTGDVHYANLLIPSRWSLLTVNDVVFMERRRGLKRLLLRWLWLSLPVARAGKVVAISEFSKREILRYCKVAPDKIAIIYVWISDAFQFSPKSFSQKPRILQVGTKPNKNVRRVIESLEGVPCTLVVVGELLPEWVALAAAKGVVLENHVNVLEPFLASLYRDCDIVSFPSLYEGFGMPIVEGQRTGRPVVTSNRCSMPEVAGDGACFVDPLSVESIRSGFLKVIEDSGFRDSLIEKGRANAGRFTRQNALEKYTALYETFFRE